MEEETSEGWPECSGWKADLKGMELGLIKLHCGLAAI